MQKQKRGYQLVALAMGITLSLPLGAFAKDMLKTETQAESKTPAATTAPATLSAPNAQSAQALQTPSVQDTPQTRETAAKAYLKVQPVEQLYQDTVNELAAQVPVEKKTEFVKTMSDAVDMPKLNQLALESLTKNFTASELQYMTQFYGSPTGQAIYSKFPNYLSDIGQGLRDVITLPQEQQAGAPGAKPEAQPSAKPAPAATKAPAKKAH